MKTNKNLHRPKVESAKKSSSPAHRTRHSRSRSNRKRNKNQDLEYGRSINQTITPHRSTPVSPTNSEKRVRVIVNEDAVAAPRGGLATQGGERNNHFSSTNNDSRERDRHAIRSFTASTFKESKSVSAA